MPLRPSSPATKVIKTFPVNKKRSPSFHKISALRIFLDILKKKLFLGILVFLICLSALISFYLKKTPVISVVLPTYNRAALLPRAIESILNQTFKDFELIIIDDGSTDETPAVLKKYAAQDKRIRLLRNEQNCGISCSRNRGIEAARGQYIAPMDSDDEAISIRLEKLLAVMKDYPELTVVTGGFYYENSDIPPQWLENPSKYTLTGNPSDMQFELLFNCPFCNVCTLIQTDFIRKNNIRYNPSYVSAEDYDFWKQILLKNGKIARISAPVVLVRFHNTNNAQYYTDQLENSFRIKKELLSRFLGEDLPEIKWGYSTLEKCALMKKIEKANFHKEIVPQSHVAHYRKKLCPSDDQKYVYLEHPNWNDFLLLKDNLRASRYFVPDNASYWLDKEVLIVIWDKWSPELFVKNKDNIYEKQKENLIQIKTQGKIGKFILTPAKQIYDIQNRKKGLYKEKKAFSNCLIITWEDGNIQQICKNPKMDSYETSS